MEAEEGKKTEPDLSEIARTLSFLTSEFQEAGYPAKYITVGRPTSVTKTLLRLEVSGEIDVGDSGQETSPLLGTSSQEKIHTEV